MAADYEAAIRGHRINLLCLGDTLAGPVEMIPHADHLLVENVAVRPAFQGRGYGRRLMMHAETVAAALGHGMIRLYTNTRFVENLRLYASLGYGIDREEPFLGGIVVHLSKPVPRP